MTVCSFSFSPFSPISLHSLQRVSWECKRTTSLRCTWKTAVSGSIAPSPPRPTRTPSIPWCGTWDERPGRRLTSSCWGSNAPGPSNMAPTQMRRDWDGVCRLRGCHPVCMCWRWTGLKAAILARTTAWWRSGWVTQMESGIDSPGIPQGSRRFWSENQVSKQCFSL